MQENEKREEMDEMELFKHHSFLSLSKIINTPYKEWMGETKNDEIVIVKYKNGTLGIGAGWNEIEARKYMQLFGCTRNILGLAMHDNNLTIEKINKDLKLEWVLPSGYIEE